MKIYSEAEVGSLRDRDLLKDWLAEGLLNDGQYERMQQETPCRLRRTNGFLRAVLFLFTLVIISAGTGLVFLLFSSGEQGAVEFLLLLSGVICYGGAEFAVAKYRLYRYGIEEALAACSVGFVCAGVTHASRVGMGASVGVVASLWIWRRFGLWYGFLAAVIFVAFMPMESGVTREMYRVIVASIYAVGLLIFVVVEGKYSVEEAMLWLGIYGAVNLHLAGQVLASSRTFYWGTFAAIWCLPAVVLWRGARRKDRFVMGAGALMAVVTMATNKPYLGWARHTWDPMLLGAVLVGIALWARRWLAAGEGGERRGFTARRMSTKDMARLHAGAGVMGMVGPQAVVGNPHGGGTEMKFGGGDSGGGGASSDF